MAGSLKEALRLYRSKRYDAALEELLAIEPGQIETTESAYYLGLCYTRLAKYDEALLFLEQVVTASTDLVRTYQARLALAYIYAITNRSRLAEFELTKLIESGYRSVQVYAAIGYATWCQGKIDQSIEFYSKALELDGENLTALNSLGYILADNDRDLSRALTCCRKAVDRKPDNPAYLDSLGWTFYKLGKLPEAREYLKRALAIAPGRPEIVAHMRAVMDLPPKSGNTPGPTEADISAALAAIRDADEGSGRVTPDGGDDVTAFEPPDLSDWLEDGDE